MKRGFTLVELMVSVSIFVIVMTISMGSILGIFDTNRKSRSLKTLANNLNLAVESMSKEIRFGKNYHCISSGTWTVPQNCPSGDTFISFLSSSGVQISYRWAGTGTPIEKEVAGGGFIAVTAPEIIIDNLTFYVFGAGTTDTLQPKVIMKIKSHAGTGNSRSDFTLETLVSQRTLDR